MKLALPGSALVHLLALGAGLLMLNWSEPEDAPAASAVSVEVISMAAVSANQTSIIQSDATETLVSSGATPVAPAPPQTIDPVKTEALQPVRAAPVEPTAAELTPPQQAQAATPAPSDRLAPEPARPVEPRPIAPIQPVEPEPVPEQLETVEPAPVQTMPVTPIKPLEAEPVLSVAAVDPLQDDTIIPLLIAPALQPEQASDLKVAPVPRMLTRPRPNTPTKLQPPQRIASAPPPQAQPTKARPSQRPAQQRPAAPAGNGGPNQADSIAAKPAGGQQGNSGSVGDAAVARYPSQVLRKLRSALRYPGGAGRASGEVHVQFIVSSTGSPSNMRVVQSSGNSAIDKAGIDTIARASPFPPIPAGAGRDSWTFTVPLAFER